MVRRPGNARRWALCLGALLLMGLALTGCAKNAPQDALSPAGPIAEKQDNLFKPIFYFAVIPVFVLVQGLVIATVIRHRHRPGRPEPVQVHGNTKLEIGWTVLPAAVLLVVAVPTIGTIFDLSREPKNALEVEVYGHLWWWEYKYKESGVLAAHELVIPTNRPVRLTLHSIEPGLPPGPDQEFAQGVIHSFWVPKLAGKIDVVPGRDNKLTIESPEPGRFLGQCAEYCNLSHANMRLAVVAKEPAEFDRWTADQKKPAATPSSADARAGLEIFKGKGTCVACHTLGGVEGAVARVGPNLTHLKDRKKFAGYIFDNTAENLTKWVADAPGMKPMRPEKGTGMPKLGPGSAVGLTGDEVDKVVAYLETLK